MSLFNPMVGEVLNVTTFTSVAGTTQVTFKRPGRKRTWVFLYLGVETEGADPLDLRAIIENLRLEPPADDVA